MTSEQFAYWLQGFAEINGRCPTEAEWTIIQDHLKTVFVKVTPERGGFIAAQYDYQQAIRDAGPLTRTETIC